MGDITDQRLVLTLTAFLRYPSAAAASPRNCGRAPRSRHSSHIHRKIQITVLNVLRRHLQLLDRVDKTRINPPTVSMHAVRIKIRTIEITTSAIRLFNSGTDLARGS